jgi:hypothetical protein
VVLSRLSLPRWFFFMAVFFFMVVPFRCSREIAEERFIVSPPRAGPAATAVPASVLRKLAKVRGAGPSSHAVAPDVSAPDVCSARQVSARADTGPNAARELGAAKLEVGASKFTCVGVGDRPRQPRDFPCRRQARVPRLLIGRRRCTRRSRARWRFRLCDPGGTAFAGQVASAEADNISPHTR